jgi:GNAT superfamily N-acetyltransferase
MTATRTWTAAMLERVLVDVAALPPDAELIDRDGWVQVTTPSRPESGFNGVIVSRLEPAEVDERITEITRYYRERNAGFRWIVGPSSTPDDLSARLERAGIPVLGVALGMYMRVPMQVPALPSTLDIRRVGLDDVDTYVDVSVRGWGEHGSRTRAETETLTRVMLTESQHARAWVVYEDGEPVGSSLLCLLPEVGYFQGAAVLPERRRRGIYMALLHHRLALLRELGVEHAVIWASESRSAGVCRKAGFQALCRAVFHDQPQPLPSAMS